MNDYNNIVEIISNKCNDILFNYDDEKCGITSEVDNGISTYQLWFGAILKEYSELDDLLNDKIFNGKSFKEIFNRLEIEVI